MKLACLCMMALWCGVAAGAATRAPLDSLVFGHGASETSHGLVAENSEVRTGGLGQPCRVLLPRTPPAATGGSLTFTLRCHPNAQTYLTARLWGGDVGATVLTLVADGKQLGCNQSDWPPLDKLNWREMEPRFPGRFFYSTYLLPQALTRGRTKLTLQLVSKGRMYSYARTYERGQHKQEKPSQGIYAVATHTDPFFVPPAGDVQGKPVAIGPPRPAPEGALGPWEHVRQQAQKDLDGRLRRDLSLPGEALALAIAYHAPWARQHRDKAALDRIIATVDTYVLRGDVKALGWFGPGELAEAIWRVRDDARAAGRFDQPLGPKAQTRRAAYAAFFRKAIDYQTEPRHRGGLTNQDIYIITSVARANLLLRELAPDRALPEATARDLVYQAIGLRPYKGRYTPGKGVQQSTAYRYIIGGPVFLSDEWDHYWVTPKGSSKEHGFVCAYGEMAQQTATLYELTGDPKVREQAIRMIAARAPFRVPANDRDGHAALRIEAVVGWRHSWYPGRLEYADQYLKAAALLGDPVSLRLAQLFIEHGRIYQPPYRPHPALLVQRVDYLRKVLAAPPSPFRFPMADGQPDFAWADEGIRAIVLKHRGRRCWLVFNWRGAGITNIARVHYAEPTLDRIANIRIATEFTPSGTSITRPRERCGPFVEPGTVLATDGEVLPLARGPLGGMGDFYSARYGDYLFAMNCTADRTFQLDVPPEHAARPLRDLISGRRLGPAARLPVPPATTLVLFLGAGQP